MEIDPDLRVLGLRGGRGAGFVVSCAVNCHVLYAFLADLPILIGPRADVRRTGLVGKPDQFPTL